MLTPRQEQVLHMAAAGYSVAGIAQVLGISPETVRYHIKHAYRRLGVHTRRDALSALGKLGTHCPECGRPFDETVVASP